MAEGSRHLPFHRKDTRDIGSILFTVKEFSRFSCFQCYRGLDRNVHLRDLLCVSLLNISFISLLKNSVNCLFLWTIASFLFPRCLFKADIISYHFLFDSHSSPTPIPTHLMWSLNTYSSNSLNFCLWWSCTFCMIDSVSVSAIRKVLRAFWGRYITNVSPPKKIWYLFTSKNELFKQETQ